MRSQADTFVGMRVTLPLDRKAYRDWFEGHGKQAANRVDEEIGKLAAGEAMVWVGATDFFERVQFPRATTYDSGRTPKHGERIDDVELPKLSDSAIAKMIADAMPKPEPEPEESTVKITGVTALATVTVDPEKERMRERIKFLEEKLEQSMSWGNTLAHVMQRAADGARDLAEQLEDKLPKSKAEPTPAENKAIVPNGVPWTEKLFGMTDEEKERYRNGYWNHPDDATPPTKVGISAEVAARAMQPIGTAPSVPVPDGGTKISPSVKKIIDVFEALAPRFIDIRRAAILGGVSPKSSAFNRYIDAAKQCGMIAPGPVEGEWRWDRPIGPERAAIDPVSTWKGMLKNATASMLGAIADAEGPLFPDEAATRAGISPNSSNVGKTIKELIGLKLIVQAGDKTVRLAEDMRI